MKALRQPGVLCIIQAVAVPLALLLAYLALKWGLWNTRAYGGELVRESPGLQERALPLLWKFVPLYALFIWLAIGGIAYAVLNRKDTMRLLTGLNFAWMLIWPLAVLGIGGGVYVTVEGIRRRSWLLPLCSLIANVLAFVCGCWYFFEGMAVFGD